MSRFRTTNLSGARSTSKVSKIEATETEEFFGSANCKTFGGEETELPKMTQLKKVAAAYARVSSDKQEKEETISSQIDSICKAAEDRNYLLSKEYIFTDDGFSGSRLDRPGLDKLRDLASEGAFEVVLFYSPDRLARNYAYQVLILEELKKTGCEVIFLNRAFNENPQEQMLLQIQGVFAEYERALIKERTRRGRLFSARQGKINWGGNPPYGFKYIKKSESMAQQILVDLSEATVIRQMYKWLVDDQMTSNAIARRLTDQGIPTRKLNKQGWCKSTIVDILRSPIYKGETYYNRTQYVDVKRARGTAGFKDIRPGNMRGRADRPKDEWIKIQLPAIIDSEYWDLAQKQMAINRERANRNNTKHEYLLKGLLICGCCQRRMIGTHIKISGSRYICSAKYPTTTAWACKGRSVSGNAIEIKVWNFISDLLSNDEILHSHYEKGKGDPAVNVKDEQEQERIQRKLKGFEKEAQRLIDAYQAGVIELDELQKRRILIEDNSRALRLRIDEIERDRVNQEKELRLLQGAMEFCESIRQEIIDPPLETKRKILQLVVDRIIVSKDDILVRHIIPTQKFRLRTEPHRCRTPYRTDTLLLIDSHYFRVT